MLFFFFKGQGAGSLHCYPPPVVALSIAGSDSGGGAGIQADLRTFHRVGVFGTTAVTAVTAQNLAEVAAVEGISPHVVTAQIDAVFGGFPVRAVKTGMLWSVEVVRAVSNALRGRAVPVVVDPVLVATTGATLFDGPAVAAYRDLLAEATLITPNLDEAAVLLGQPSELPIDLDDQFEMAWALARRFGTAVLLKGGHLEGAPTDVFVEPRSVMERAWVHSRIEGVGTHGTGCALSAAIAGYLAQALPLAESIKRGLAFVHDALVQGAARGSPLPLIEQATPDLAHLSLALRD